MMNQPRWTNWLYPPVLLCATVCGALFVLGGPTHLVAWVLGALLAAVVLWILISALIPSTSNKTCPACGKAGMQRVSETAKQGARCAYCLHEDPERSSFLLAEEDAYMEPGAPSPEECIAREKASDVDRSRRRVRSLQT